MRLRRSRSRHTCNVRVSLRPCVQHREDIARQVQVEGEFVRPRPRPWARRPPPPPAGACGRSRVRTVPGSRSAGAGAAGSCRPRRPRAPAPPIPGCAARCVSAAVVTSGVSGSRTASDVDHLRVGLFLHLTDRARRAAAFLDDAWAPRRERDLQHRLVGRDHPGLPPGEVLRGVHHVLEHGEREGARSNGSSTGCEPALGVAEGLHGQGDHAHGAKGSPGEVTHGLPRTECRSQGG